MPQPETSRPPRINIATASAIPTPSKVGVEFEAALKSVTPTFVSEALVGCGVDFEVGAAVGESVLHTRLE